MTNGSMSDEPGFDEHAVDRKPVTAMAANNEVDFLARRPDVDREVFGKIELRL